MYLRFYWQRDCSPHFLHAAQQLKPSWWIVGWICQIENPYHIWANHAIVHPAFTSPIGLHGLFCVSMLDHAAFTVPSPGLPNFQAPAAIPTSKTHTRGHDQKTLERTSNACNATGSPGLSWASSILLCLWATDDCGTPGCTLDGCSTNPKKDVSLKNWHPIVPHGRHSSIHVDHCLSKLPSVDPRGVIPTTAVSVAVAAINHSCLGHHFRIFQAHFRDLSGPFWGIVSWCLAQVSCSTVEHETWARHLQQKKRFTCQWPRIARLLAFLCSLGAP